MTNFGGGYKIFRPRLTKYCQECVNFTTSTPHTSETARNILDDEIKLQLCVVIVLITVSRKRIITMVAMTHAHTTNL